MRMIVVAVIPSDTWIHSDLISGRLSNKNKEDSHPTTDQRMDNKLNEDWRYLYFHYAQLVETKANIKKYYDDYNISFIHLSKEEAR